ncbi:MAG: hypothetical protein V4472_12525 [Pseudomonadota bacterium]
MKFSRVTAAIVMASLSSPLFAAAEQSVGKLTAVSEGTFVSRNGTLMPATAGQSLYAGDRVVTRGTAKAKASFPGCDFTIAPTSVLSVSQSSCASTTKSFVQDDTGDGSEGAGGSSGGYVVGGLALLAVAGGIVAATSNSDSKPASP